jgi:hypothetical protein
MSITPVLMVLTHLSRISQVSSSSTATVIAMATTAGASLLSHWGMELPPKKAHFGALLRVSSRYVWGAICSLRGSLDPPIFVHALKEVIYGCQEP